MKRLVAVQYFFLGCSVFVLCFSSHAFAKKPFTAIVTKVIDGDSLKVRAGRKNYEIRLYGIDAPEYDQPYASKAKKLVKKAILGKKVLVTPVEWDRYHRLVAMVDHDDQSINKWLITSGLAWYYPRYCKMKVCRDWKQEGEKSRERKKNIWSTSLSVAPWKWKRDKHKR